jgi:hypothetical protein
MSDSTRKLQDAIFSVIQSQGGGMDARKLRAEVFESLHLDDTSKKLFKQTILALEEQGKVDIDEEGNVAISAPHEEPPEAPDKQTIKDAVCSVIIDANRSGILLHALHLRSQVFDSLGMDETDKASKKSFKRIVSELEQTDTIAIDEEGNCFLFDKDSELPSPVNTREPEHEEPQEEEEEEEVKASYQEMLHHLDSEFGLSQTKHRPSLENEVLLDHEVKNIMSARKIATDEHSDREEDPFIPEEVQDAKYVRPFLEEVNTYSEMNPEFQEMMKRQKEKADSKGPALFVSKPTTIILRDDED